MVSKAQDFFARTSLYALNNRLFALVLTAVLSLTIYTDSIALGIVSLIALRKGFKSSIEPFIISMLVHGFVEFYSKGYLIHALVETLVNYVPVYVGSLLLRKYVDLKVVIAGFAAMLVITLFGVQVFAPEYILKQVVVFKMLLSQMPESMAHYFNNLTDVNLYSWASLIVGIQAFEVLLSAFVLLLCARAVQSKLFFPGEFDKELHSIRGDINSLIAFSVVFLCGSLLRNSFMIMLMPTLISYFLFLGFMRIRTLFCNTKLKMVVFCGLLVVVPVPGLIICIIVAILDCIGEFRKLKAL